MSYRGFSAPFFDMMDNPLPEQSGDRLLKNDLLQLLYTSPGERVKRPNFGSPLKRFLFENMSEGEIGILKSDIIENIRVNDPRFNITSLYIEPNRDENSITIKLTTSVIGRMGDDLEINIKRLVQ